MPDEILVYELFFDAKFNPTGDRITDLGWKLYCSEDIDGQTYITEMHGEANDVQYPEETTLTDIDDAFLEQIVLESFNHIHAAPPFTRADLNEKIRQKHLRIQRAHVEIVGELPNVIRGKSATRPQPRALNNGNGNGNGNGPGHSQGGGQGQGQGQG